MSPLLEALGLLVLPFVVGAPCLRALGLGDRADRLGHLGWSSAAGCLVLGLVLFVASWLELRLVHPGAVADLALAGSLALAALELTRRLRAGGRHQAPRTPPALRLAIVLALGVALLRVVDASLWPALTGDEAMLWGYRARVIASSGGLGPDFVAAMADPALRHEDYPLLVSLLQAFALELTGEGGTVLLRLPVQAAALGLVASLAAALRRHVGGWTAAALLVTFTALPHTRSALTSAGAEAPVALGLVLAVDGWLRRRADGDDRWLGLSALGLALALFTKNDARLFVLALGIGLLAARLLTHVDERRAKPRAAVAWALLPGLVLGAGAAYNAWAGFENDLTTGKGTGRGLFARLIDQPLAAAPDAEGSYLTVTARFFAEEVLLHPRYDGLVLLGSLVALGPLLVLARRRRRDPDGAGPGPGHAELPGQAAPDAPTAAAGLALAVAAGLAGLVLVYLATPQPLAWHLASSAPRVTWQLVPLACLALGLAVSPLASPRPGGTTTEADAAPRDTPTIPATLAQPPTDPRP